MEFIVKNKHGDVLAQVDDLDADLTLGTWSLAGGKGSRGKYVARAARRNGKQTTEYLHRIIAVRMGLIAEVAGSTGGRWTSSIDHRNGEKLDCRRSNLRLRTRSQQATNPNDGLRRNNTSGVRGVSYIKGQRRWYAHATENKRSISLGTHLTKEEAVAARRAWESARE